jgi:hypothetical protein
MSVISIAATWLLVMPHPPKPVATYRLFEPEESFPM